MMRHTFLLLSIVLLQASSAEAKLSRMKCLMKTPVCLGSHFQRLLIVRDSVAEITENLSPMEIVLLVNDEPKLGAMKANVDKVGELKKDLDNCFGADTWFVDCKLANKIKPMVERFMGGTADPRVLEFLDRPAAVQRSLETLDVVYERGLMTTLYNMRACLRDMFKEHGDLMDVASRFAKEEMVTTDDEGNEIRFNGWTEERCAKTKCLSSITLERLRNTDEAVCPLKNLVPDLFDILLMARDVMTKLDRPVDCRTKDTLNEFVCDNIDACYRDLQHDLVGDDDDGEPLLDEESVQRCNGDAVNRRQNNARQEQPPTRPPTTTTTKKPKFFCRFSRFFCG